MSLTLKYCFEEDVNNEILAEDYPPPPGSTDPFDLQALLADMPNYGFESDIEYLQDFYIVKYGHTTEVYGVLNLRNWLATNKDVLTLIKIIGTTDADVDYLFKNCEKLAFVDLNDLVLSGSESIEGLFSLKSAKIRLKNMDTTGVKNFSNVFNVPVYADAAYVLLQTECAYWKQWAIDNIADPHMADSDKQLVYIALVMLLEGTYYITFSIHEIALKSLTGSDLENYLIAYNEINNSELVEEEEEAIQIAMEDFDIDDGTTYYAIFDAISVYINRYESLVPYWNKCIASYSASTVSTGYENWNVSSGEKFENFFSGLSNLVTADISNWDLSNCKNFYKMFANSAELSGILYGENTFSNAENVESLFEGCSDLVTDQLPYLSLNNVTNAQYFYKDCTSLASVDSNQWNLNTSIDMDNFFDGCTALTTADFSNYDFGSSHIKYFFKDCHSLQTLNIANADFTEVTSLEGFLYKCTILKNIILYDIENMPSEDTILWNIPNVTNLDYAFYGCYASYDKKHIIEPLHYRAFPTSQVTSMKYIFSNAGKEIVQSVTNLSGWDSSNATNLQGMFSALDTSSSSSSSSRGDTFNLDLRRINTTSAQNMSHFFENLSISETNWYDYFYSFILPGESARLDSIYRISQNRTIADPNAEIIKTGNKYKFSNSITEDSRCYLRIFVPQETKLTVTAKGNFISGSNGIIGLYTEEYPTSAYQTLYCTSTEASREFTLLPGLNELQLIINDNVGSWIEATIPDIEISNTIYSWHIYNNETDYGYRYDFGKNIGAINISNATNLSYMFYNTGKNYGIVPTYDTQESRIINRLNIAPNSFDTSKAEDISYMFNNSDPFYQDLPLNFESAKNISGMFGDNRYYSFRYYSSTYSQKFTPDTTNPKKLVLNSLTGSSDYKYGDLLCKIKIKPGDIVSYSIPYNYQNKGYSKCNLEIFIDNKQLIDYTGWKTSGTLTGTLSPGVHVINVNAPYYADNQPYEAASIILDDLIGTKDTYVWEDISGQNIEYRSIDISSLNFGNNIENMSGLFKNSSLDQVDYINEIYFPTINTENVTNMSELFFGERNLSGVYNIENWNTSKVQTMKGMFCTDAFAYYLNKDGTYSQSSSYYTPHGSITNLDLSNWNTPNLEDISYMFCWQDKLTNLNISNFSTSKIEKMDFAFYKVPGPIAMPTTTFDSITDISYWYANKSLSWFDINLFANSNITSMDGLFQNCTTKFTSIAESGINILNTRNCTSMNNLFEGCDALASADLSSLDLQNITSAEYLFKGCKKLKTIDLGNLDSYKLKNLKGFLYGCPQIESVNFEKNTSCRNLIKQYMFGESSSYAYDNVASVFDMARSKSIDFLFSGAIIGNLDWTKMWQYLDMEDPESEEAKALLAEIVSSAQPWSYTNNYVDSNKGLFSEAKIYGKSINLTLPKLSIYNKTFMNVWVPEELNLSTINMSSIRSFSNFLNGVTAKVVDLSNWNVSLIPDLSGIYSPSYGCNAETLKCNNWVVSLGITDLSRFFQGCGAKEIQLNNWNLGAITNVSRMFSNCENLTTLQLEGFDTSEVTDFSYMFNNCYSLYNFDVSWINTSKAETLDGMFYNACNEGTLDVSMFDLSNNPTLLNIFSGTKVETLNVSNWDLTDFNEMNLYVIFQNTKAINIVMNNFNWGDTTEALIGVFRGCYFLESVTGNWIGKNVKLVCELFKECIRMYSFNTNVMSGFNNLEILSSICDGYGVSTTYARTQLTDITYEGTFNKLHTIDSIIMSYYSTYGYSTVDRNGNKEVVSYTNTLYVTFGNLIAPELRDISRIFEKVYNTLRGPIDMSNCVVPKLSAFPGMSKNTSSGTQWPYNVSSIIYPTCKPEPFERKYYSAVVSSKRLYNNSWQYVYENPDTSIETVLYQAGLFSMRPEDNDGSMRDLSEDFIDANREVAITQWKMWDSESTYIPKLSRLGAYNITGTLDINGIDFSNQTDFSYLVSNCPAPEINLPQTIWSHAKYLDHAFDGCDGLTEIPSYLGDFPELISATYMFANCNELESYDISGWNCPKLLYLKGMFNNSYKSHYDSEQKKTIYDPVSFNFQGLYVPKLVDISYMFSYCYSIVDVSGLQYLNAPELRNIYNLFNECISLQTKDVTLENLIFPKLKTFSESIQRLENSDEWEELPIKYTDGTSFLQAKTVTIKNCTFDSLQYFNLFNFGGYTQYIEQITINNIIAPNLISMAYAFYNQDKLTNISITNFNTSNCKEFGGMFHNCINLENVDLTSFDFSSAEHIGGMFNKCNALKTVDMNNLDFGKVEDLTMCRIDETSYYNLKFFNNCSNLEQVILTNTSFPELKTFDMLHIDEIGYINGNYSPSSGRPYTCKITDLDLSTTSLPKVEDMSYLTAFCPNLTTLKFKNTKYENLTNMEYLCYNNQQLNIISIPNKEAFKKVTNLYKSFYNCKALETFDFKSFDLPKIENSSYAFAECSGLQSIDFTKAYEYVLDGFKFKIDFQNKDINNSFMFYNCTNLATINATGIPRIDGANPVDGSGPNSINMESIYENCTNLVEGHTYLTLRYILTYKGFNAKNMYKNCVNMTSLGNEDLYPVMNCGKLSFVAVNSMFENCEKLEGPINTENWSGRILSIIKMFKNCKALTGELKLKGLISNNTVCYENAFDNCNNLTTIVTKVTKLNNNNYKQSETQAYNYYNGSNYYWNEYKVTATKTLTESTLLQIPWYIDTNYPNSYVTITLDGVNTEVYQKHEHSSGVLSLLLEPGSHTIEFNYQVQNNVYQYTSKNASITLPSDWSVTKSNMSTEETTMIIYTVSAEPISVFADCVNLVGTHIDPDTQQEVQVPYDPTKTDVSMANSVNGYFTWVGPSISFFFNGEEYSGLVFNGTEISSLYFNGNSIF